MLPEEPRGDFGKIGTSLKHFKRWIPPFDMVASILFWFDQSPFVGVLNENIILIICPGINFSKRVLHLVLWASKIYAADS